MFSLHILRIIIALAMIGCLQAPAPAQAAPGPSGGYYQPQDRSATCELTPQADGSWQLRFWEGSSISGPGEGLAWSARLVRLGGKKTFTGIWQALPGSCCPGRGRLEVRAIDNQTIRFVLFTPAMDKGAWPRRQSRDFRLSAPLAQRSMRQNLVGDWRMRLWYLDLLPSRQPADPEDGLVRIEIHKGQLRASWQEQPGGLAISTLGGQLSLVYEDRAQGFKLEAVLDPMAGGLAYGGAFKSTLGLGRMYLVRSALPMDPPGGAAEPEGGLSGLWVDPRTGSDFMAITQQQSGLEFETYGGSRKRPRYLSQGQAKPTGPDRFVGTARDAKGQCCGNQVRLILRRLGPDRLEVSSFWWPANQPDPGHPPANPYVLVRTKKKHPGPSHGGWPAVFDSRRGLMGRDQGAVRVEFTYRPSKERPQPATLFCQGGYRRELEMFIDLAGRLAARLATEAGKTLRIMGRTIVTPDKPHTAWLIYQKGGRMALYLDGQLQAAAPLTSPWAGSVAPYLLGASRWPNRDFSGHISQAQLWAQAQDPTAPGPPEATLTPGPQGTGQDQAQRLKTLYRLWHPTWLKHAYAIDPDRIRSLTSQGYRMQGPLGKLYANPNPKPEGQELWAHEHRQLAYTILSTNQEPPTGFKALGRMGYMPSKSEPNTRPLLEMQADFPEPLRKLTSQDRLYTTRPDQAATAIKFGYGRPVGVGLLLRADEPPLAPIALYNWSGSWQGDGWGHFFIKRKGRRLDLFLYYSTLGGPHYLGRYHIATDGLSAQGIAVGNPGPRATYYRHRLVFKTDAPSGPRIEMTSQRLAAPLEDGRLVKFKRPGQTRSTLTKRSQFIPPKEAAVLRRSKIDPAAQYRRALEQAQAQGRLLKR